MATRATRLSHEHVSALNMIDIEFYGGKIFGVKLQNQKEKKVTNAWKTYNDHLNNKYPEERMEAWVERSDDLFTTLLYTIAQSLGYDFDEVQLKRDCYRPIAHGNIEEQQHIIRRGMEEVLAGKRSIPMAVTYFPSNAYPETGASAAIDEK